MRPRYPVEVVVKDPVRRDDDGRPRLVFLWLTSEEDLRRLEVDVASGKYNVLNGLEPAALVEDIARARKKRRRKPAEGAEGAEPAQAHAEAGCADDYEDVLDEDEEGDPVTGLEVQPPGDEAREEGANGDGVAEHQENHPQ